MDLETARRIARTPDKHKPPRLWRSLSILMRWAAEPCTDAEYWRRIKVCRKVKEEAEYIEYLALKKARKYRPKRSEPSTLSLNGLRRGWFETARAAASSGYRSAASPRYRRALAPMPSSASPPT